VRLLQRRTKLTERDFVMLARALNRARTLHPVYLTAWVFLPDHWHVTLAAELTLVIAVETEGPRNSLRLNPETDHVG
jgi:REP element-mobilizing transposase RayT